MNLSHISCNLMAICMIGLLVVEIPISVFYAFSHVQVGNVTTSFHNELVVITTKETQAN